MRKLRCARAAALAAVLALACAASAQEPRVEPAGKKRKPVQTEVSGFEMLPPEELAERTTVAAATRGLKPPPPTPLAPYLGKGYDTRPTFLWSTSAPEVVLTLRSSQGAELLKKTVTGNRYQHTEEPPLAPGETYEWSVRSPRGGESEPVALVIVAGAERSALESALGGSPALGAENRLARARTLAEHRLWYDALAAYTDLIADHPERAELFEERGALFAQIPKTQKQSEQDLARARELRESARP